VKTHNRYFGVSIIILLLFSCLCTRIPLLNYLGFEFSAFTVLITGFIAGLLTLSFWKKYSAKHTSNIWRFLGQIFSAQLVLFMVPFLISLANAVFVKNCSIGNGAILYVLIVLPGMVFSISLAVFIGVVIKKWRKTFYTILYLLILLYIPLVTLLRPQIFAFNPIIGFFSGFTYDESLQIIQRLSIFRAATLAASGFILASAGLIRQTKTRKKKLSREPRHSLPMTEIAMLAFFGPIVVVIFLLSDRLGLSSSEEFIKQKLVGNYRTKHFEIVYPAGTVSRDRIEQLGHLHEFYFEKISEELNINYRECITSFIYASPEQKGRLVGAANTDIAKPWLQQIHINLHDVESVLKHELVHALAGEFGWLPMRVAANIGLEEGLAVAVDKMAMEEPLDRASALALAAGINPDLESLFAITGFVRMNASVSYTLAGSFCSSLVDSFGIDKFKDLYRTGDFNAVYKKDLRSLLISWQNSIKNIPLSKTDSDKALYFYKRPSIFGKECARVIANLNSETKEFLDNRELEKALHSAEKSLRLSRTSTAISQKTNILFELHRYQDVVEFIKNQLSDTTLRHTLLFLHSRLGDAYWAMDSLDLARHEFELIASINIASWYEEAIPLRLESMKDIHNQNDLKNYFICSMQDSIRITRLVHLNSPVARYLLAREYTAKWRFAESIRIFESLGSMKSRALEYFRLKRLGRGWFELQKYEKANAIFEKSLSMAPTAYLRYETTEWIEKCVYMQNNLQKNM
jgi:tetratricopeptide (TPR) repeat protein